MIYRRILGLAAVVVAAVGVTLATPGEAHARKRCCNGYNGYGSNGYYYGHHGRAYAYAAPAYGAPAQCATAAPPTNPDGTIAPQPGYDNPQAPAQPNAAPPPAPAPPSTLN